MQKKNEPREFKLTEGDDRFWADLRALSESLGWELSQTLKACFALGWNQLTQNVKSNDEGSQKDDE